jgi:hypothetical protein
MACVISGSLERMPLRVQSNDLIRPQCVQAVRATMRVTKLHLECIGGEFLDNSANLTGDKPQLR